MHFDVSEELYCYVQLSISIPLFRKIRWYHSPYQVKEQVMFGIFWSKNIRSDVLSRRFIFYKTKLQLFHPTKRNCARFIPKVASKQRRLEACSFCRHIAFAGAIPLAPSIRLQLNRERKGAKNRRPEVEIQQKVLSSKDPRAFEHPILYTAQRKYHVGQYYRLVENSKKVRNLKPKVTRSYFGNIVMEMSESSSTFLSDIGICQVNIR